MGLDAIVYCDCYEQGRLLIQPPYPDLITLSENGAPSIDPEADSDKLEAHDEWEDCPDVCEHGGLTLIEHHLGTVSHIVLIRQLVSRIAASTRTSYPILLEDVIYSGSHFGDCIPAENVPMLKEEIELLSSHLNSGLSSEENEQLGKFVGQMRELVEAALSVNKSIAF